jgi:hypothetical protein
MSHDQRANRRSWASPAWRTSAGEHLRVIANPFASFNTFGAAFETVPAGGTRASVWQFNLPGSSDPGLPTAAARGGTSFVSDRTTLRWLPNDGGHHDVYAWSLGYPNPQSTPVV